MKVLCFGDSNTYGYDPRGYLADRYDEQSRWPELVAARTGWEVVNGGLCGREIPRTNQWLPSFSEYDCVLLMLGTNDLLQGATAKEAAARMEYFLSALLPLCHQILLVAPPPMQRGVWVPTEALVTESINLAEEYRLLAEKLHISFVDTRHWRIELAFDGVHFSENGHHTFANCLKESLSAALIYPQ